MSDLEKLLTKLRGEIDDIDAAKLAELARAYDRMVYKPLQGDIDALTKLIEASHGYIGIKNTEEYKRLIADANSYLEKWGAYLEGTVTTTATGIIPLGIEHAEMKAVTAGLTGTFRKFEPTVIEKLLKYLDEGSPLYQRINKMAPTYADKIAQSIIDGVTSGLNPRTIAAGITRDAGMALTDSLRMTRTVQIWSYREANRASYIANGDVVDGWIWYADLATACASCWAMHGTFHPNTETLNDHYNGHCYTGDTLVSGTSIEALKSRRYDGDVLSITTASGQFFTVTPDHPILTINGWIRAQELQAGDYVIRYSGEQWTSSAVNPNEYHRPTAIKDVASTLGMSWLGGVPKSTKNLYGYREYPKINIESANSLLRNNRIIPHPLTKHNLTSRLLYPQLAGISAQNKLALAYESSPAGSLGFQNPLFVLFGAVPLSRQFISRETTSNLNTTLDEPVVNDSTGNPEDFRKFVLRYPGLVHPDKIINIDVTSFHGLVYNLQTKDRWYIASSIITHNCTDIPVVHGANPGIETGKNLFEQLDESRQREVLGDSKFEAWKDGKFEFSRLSTQTPDDVYTSMRSETPLKDLVGE